MVFDESIKFYGTYRPYQQRALNNISSFLENDKIHIVAAPGSGKTILGLELIKRINKACLILVPSIAIREQWIERFSTCFLSNIEDKDKWISNDIKNPRPMICITYQALYSAYKKEKNNEIDEEFVGEETNYLEFNLFEAIKENNIQTICLDECHHLKSEWWKVLEDVVSNIEGAKIISLTATPPYDSSAKEWQKYIDLCGPIDEEIFVPELINDHNLCPHQDYVYFSYPTDDETKEIMKFYHSGERIFAKYKNNETLVQIVSSNKVYKNIEIFKDLFLKNREYAKALVLFLYENKVKVPRKILRMVKVEPFNIGHLEILLQHIMFDSSEYFMEHELIFSMKKEFAALGLVHKRVVHLQYDERISKMVSLSNSKLESIKTIVENENESMKGAMKCLVLTDYIKIKTKSYIGNESKKIDQLGSIPIFEYIRRANLNNVTLCCLSGSICIVPENCLIELQKHDNFDKATHLINQYYEIPMTASNRKQMVLIITKLFEQGYFNVLIGTKALLGEGWDSPCINTLIIASFIGSYVLSNQMRGRAIRTNSKDPNKIANIWHLVCLDPHNNDYSFDYQTAKKRFSSFLGINKEQVTVESGIERLSIPSLPNNEEELKVVNEYTLSTSKDREGIKISWEECISKTKRLDNIVKVTYIPTRRLNYDYSFIINLSVSIALFILLTSDGGLIPYLHSLNIQFKNILFITIPIAVVMLSVFLLFLIRCLRLISPKRKLINIGKATLNSLKKLNIIESKKIKVKAHYNGISECGIYLENASTYEQNIFSDCIKDIFSPIKSPRYLLRKPNYTIVCEYYVLPELFKKNKDNAKIFEKELSKKFGRFHLVFAKGHGGKNAVLVAQQLYKFKYKNIDIFTKNILINETGFVHLGK